MNATTGSGDDRQNLQVLASSETLNAEGYLEYTYLAPSANFNVTISYQDANGADLASAETVEEAPAETPADSNDTPVVSNP